MANPGRSSRVPQRNTPASVTASSVEPELCTSSTLPSGAALSAGASLAAGASLLSVAAVSAGTDPSAPVVSPASSSLPVHATPIIDSAINGTIARFVVLRIVASPWFSAR